ncbi:T9SS type A sorting domain-containing protein [Flavihumibacter petaseus]|uniref:T9SS type A sorting domain-containing protein n=1 Tax=Flavihumibacter petaseus TaxID=549295 RepID=UPI001C3F2DC8|nr:T9SS type A sorting domain-containing protein [Flavihumibacter petaseus]
MLSASAAGDDVTCYNAANGKITVSSPTGGSGEYEFRVNGGTWQEGLVFSNLAPNTYTIDIRDKNNPACIITLPGTVTIDQPAVLSAAAAGDDVTCYNAANGKITISGAVGGSGEYEFRINSGSWQEGLEFSNLAPDTYTIQIRDKNNPACIVTLPGTVTIDQPAVLSASAAGDDVTCYNAANGKITVSSPTGGSGEYEFRINGGTWQDGLEFSNLAPDTYTIDIRDKNTPTCIITLPGTVTIHQPAVLSASAAGDDVTCYNAANGKITVSSPSGGSGDYQFRINSGVWQDGLVFDNLAPDTYTVDIRDKNNPACIITLPGTITIDQPAVLSASAAGDDVTCYNAANGKITVSGAVGGSGEYEFRINSGTWQEGLVFNNLAPNTYTVDIRDKNNPACIITLPGTITIDQPAALSASATPTNATCFSGTDGKITVSSPAGGSGAFEFRINGGTWQEGLEFTGLTANSYTLEIRDKNNTACVVTIPGAVVVGQPAVLSGSVSHTNVSCNGNSDGSITINSPAGGSGNYEYSRNGGTTWQSTASFTGLPADVYSVVIRDANNHSCFIVLDNAVQVGQPLALNAAVSTDGVSCYGAANGAIHITAPVGGSGNYSYSINGGTSWQPNGNFTGLAGNTYDVRIRDVMNIQCEVILNATLAVFEPQALQATMNKDNVTCFGASDGKITIVNPSGGYGTYEYSINNGGAWSSNPQFTGLPFGTYNVLLRDAAHTNCSITIQSNVQITQPAVIAAGINSTNVTCNGAGNGTITINNPTGGSGAYQYSITGGSSWFPGNQFTSVTPGIYSVWVRDAANPTCFTVINNSVSISQPAALTASAAAPAIGCNGGMVNVTVSANGGTPGYSYKIDGGDYTNSNILNAGAGAHTITVKDVNGCETSTSITVNEAPELTIYIVNQTPSGCQTATGSVTLIGSGGVAPYKYSFIGGGYGTNNVFTGVAAGSYLASVKDANGCITPILVNIASASAPTAFSVQGGGSFCNGQGAVVSLNASQTGVSYQLVRNGNTLVGSPVNGLNGMSIDFGNQTTGGTYTVVATETATGCTNTMNGAAVINAGTVPNAFLVSGGGAYCNGAGVTILLSGSESGVSYQLIRSGSINVGAAVTGNGLGIEFSNITTPGSYTIVASNIAAGCINTMLGSANVAAGTTPTAFTVTGGGSYCSGAGPLIGLSGSTSGVNYQLVLNGSSNIGSQVPGNGNAISFGNQTATGTYTVIATNATSSCTNNMSGSALISTQALPAAFAVTGGGTFCNGAGVSVGLASSEAGMTYQLVRGGVTNVGAALTGNGGDLDFGVQTIGGTYTVIAKNAGGCTVPMNGNAVVVAGSNPTLFSVTGGGSYCSGPGLAIGLSGSTSGVNYQLVLNGTTNVGGTVSGNGNAISFGNLTAAGVYTVIATNAATGCTSNMNSNASITSSNLPAAFNVTGGGTFCNGTGVTVGLSGSESGMTYQLVRGGVTNVGAAVSGNGGDIDFGLQTISGTYTVVAKNAGGCTTTMNNNAVVLAGVVPSSFSVTGGGAFCSGPGVSVGLSSSQTGVTYQLVRDGNTNVGAAASGNGNAIDFGLQTINGTYTVVATHTNTGCTNNMSGSALVTAGSQPTAFSVTGGGTYCNGAGGIIGLSSSQGGVSYQLKRNGSNVGSALTGNGGYLDFGIQTVTGTYTVQATNLTTNCVADMIGSASIQNGASATLYTVNGGGSICNGSAPALSLSGSQSGWNYQLLLNGSNLGSAISGNGNVINFPAITSAGTYTVRATATAGGCTADMAGSAVYTNSVAVQAGNITGGGAVCAGTNSGTLTLVNYSGNIVKWEYSTDGGGIWTPIANTSASQPYTNLAQATMYRALVEGCSQAYSTTATMTMSAGATGGSVSSTSVCSGANSGIVTLSGQAGSVLYWEYADGSGPWNTISNTGTTQSFTNLTQTRKYRAYISGGSCGGVYSGEGVVNVTASVVSGTLNGATAWCSKTNSGTLTLTGYAGTIMRWESSKDGTNFNTVKINNVAVTSPSYTYSNLTQTTWFRVRVQGCTEAYSTRAIVTISGTLNGGTISSTAVCSGTNSGTVVLSGFDGAVQLWEASDNLGQTWFSIPGTGTTQNFSNLSATRQYRALIGNGSCPAVYSAIGTVTVTASTNPGTLNGAASYCGASNSGNLSLTGYAGTITRWEYSTDGTNYTTLKVNNVTVTSPTYNYTNLGVSTWYRVRVEGCTALYSNVAKITITQGSIGGTVSGGSGCSGSNSGTVTLSGYAGDIQLWEYSTNNGQTWNTIQSTATSQPYNNLTTTRRYRALVKLGTCPAAYSAEGIVTISANVVAGSLSGATTHCTKTNSGTMTLTGFSGTIVRWESSKDGTNYNTVKNGNVPITSPSYSYTNLVQTMWYRVRVEGCGFQYSNVVKITVGGCPTARSTTETLSTDIKLEQVNANDPLAVNIFPNPSANYFKLQITSKRPETANIQVSDAAGRAVERMKATSGETVQFGGGYVQGMYLVEVVQGTERKVIKIIKL